MIYADPDVLLRTYVPLVYLHPQEKSMLSSIEWLLDRANLFGASGNPELAPAGSVSALMAAGAQEGWYLALRNDEARVGQGAGAPIYGSCRTITRDGQPVAFDLSYWLFYPFNGNIFALGKARAILGSVVAAGTLAAFLYPPYGYAVLAAAAAALNYVNSVSGVQMHESDWEHVTVRIDENGAILGVYYSAHAEGRWRFQQGALGSPSSNCYQLVGTRPVVYSALESHALYPQEGTISRLGGFADDYTAQGQLWDPLDDATTRNPMGRLVNIGNDINNPPVGAEWIQYPGLWGKPGGGGGVYVEWFGTDLQEYADGKQGPAQRSQWTDGDDEGPTNWSSAPAPLPVQPCGGTLALAQYKGFLCAVYTTPTDNAVACAVWNGTRWTQPDVPGLGVLGGNSAICMAEFQGQLHSFFRVSGDLEWAVLVIGDDGKTKGWSYADFPAPLRNPAASGAVAAAAYEDELVLMFECAGTLVMFGFDGTDWTDLTGLYPVLRNWTADGPVALAAYAGTLHLAYGSGGTLKLAEFTAAAGWTDVTPAAPRTASGGAVLTSFGGYLYLAYANGGTVSWSRRTLLGPWLTDSDGNDFPVTGVATGTGDIGVAPFGTGNYLSLVYPAPGGALQQTDMLGG